jgi:hypothetical protein
MAQLENPGELPDGGSAPVPWPEVFRRLLDEPNCVFVDYPIWTRESFALAREDPVAASDAHRKVQ